ncbi:MAG: alkaline phosphatase [Alphaproteobacteria bacterium]|nr:alkaline phosphatase [Alphaproteobacteria bacterium]
MPPIAKPRPANRLDLSRRRLLRGLGAAGLLPLAGPAFLAACAPTRVAGYPFTLGVASGYPLPTSVALWTRLAPEPLQAGGGMPPEPVAVQWEVAKDEGMAAVVRRGAQTAVGDWAHAVHVEVDGLEPNRPYWYRFRAGMEASAIGRTRTAPATDAAVERLRFAVASCQHYEQGYFGAYRHIVADDPELIVHLGDYIYESPSSRGQVRRHGAPEPITLDDYRIRHALYKTDPDLQAAHAHCPWLFTWDDHEVENDYADDLSENLDPRAWFRQRRAAAYRAYYEHMPLRRQMLPLGHEMRLFHRISHGGLVDFHILDDRQYRAAHVCPRPGRGGTNVVEVCPERLDPTRGMLGATQERWLEAGLDGSRARWNVLAQQTLMAQNDSKPGPGQRFWTDGWDGYPAARRKLLDYLARRKPANPVVIGGDVHSFWVSDLKPDFDDPASPVVASEFCGSSITSGDSRTQAFIEASRVDNPHIKFADVRSRGYMRVEVTAGRWRTDLRAMANVAEREAACSTLASFVVEDGRPGPVAA